MNSTGKWCAILFLATSVAAQTSTPPKARKARPSTLTAADVQSLKDAIASQQAALEAQHQEIQELRDELHRKDQAVTQAQTAATDAASKADAAQAQASQQQASVVELKSDVTDLKTNINNTALTLQETQKNVTASMESPSSLHYKGITITPGGFLAAEFVRRSRALGGEATPFNSLTMPGATQSTLSEFFGSGRQSRLSMLATAQLKNAKINGYYEADFLSAGVTSNNNQTNSYTLRQRQAYAQAAMTNGWTITGGQMWTLLTETKHGVDNRTEATPMTIDPNYTVGFSFARQYGLRVSKDFGEKVWLAASMENSQATVTTHGNGANWVLGSLGASGGLYNAFNANYSFNPAPDIIAKAVFEPGFGHYEVFGIYSRFRDRVFPCGEVASTTTLCGGSTVAGANALGANNVSTNGGGVGANVRWSFDNKRIDFGLHGLTGRGIGRYSASGLADASVRADGSLDLIRTYQGLATLEWHGPKLDVYLNGGADYAGRASGYDAVSNKYVGYGSPFFANSGCYAETVPGTAVTGTGQSGGFLPGGLSSCTSDTRMVAEGTLGFWYKFYNGPKGRLQWGPQYSYVARYTWSGTGFTPGIGVAPHGLDGMVFTSLRYYLP